MADIFYEGVYWSELEGYAGSFSDARLVPSPYDTSSGEKPSSGLSQSSSGQFIGSSYASSSDDAYVNLLAYSFNVGALDPIVETATGMEVSGYTFNLTTGVIAKSGAASASTWGAKVYTATSIVNPTTLGGAFSGYDEEMYINTDGEYSDAYIHQVRIPSVPLNYANLTAIGTIGDVSSSTDFSFTVPVGAVTGGWLVFCVIPDHVYDSAPPSESVSYVFTQAYASYPTLSVTLTDAVSGFTGWGIAL